MKKIVGATIILVIGICMFVMTGFAKGAAKGMSGEAEFKEHCAVCHPDGGNIINPQKTLHKKNLEANNIKKPEDIIKIMRNPGPGMTPFDEKTIPDKDAQKIAEYILKTFK